MLIDYLFIKELNLIFFLYVFLYKRLWLDYTLSYFLAPWALLFYYYNFFINRVHHVCIWFMIWKLSHVCNMLFKNAPVKIINHTNVFYHYYYFYYIEYLKKIFLLLWNTNDDDSYYYYYRIYILLYFLDEHNMIGENEIRVKFNFTTQQQNINIMIINERKNNWGWKNKSDFYFCIFDFHPGWLLISIFVQYALSLLFSWLFYEKYSEY